MGKVSVLCCIRKTDICISPFLLSYLWLLQSQIMELISSICLAGMYCYILFQGYQHFVIQISLPRVFMQYLTLCSWGVQDNDSMACSASLYRAQLLCKGHTLKHLTLTWITRFLTKRWNHNFLSVCIRT